MKCPVCEREGEKSILYPPQYYMTTLMFDEVFFDEDGKRHHHDPNHSGGVGFCSRGHRLSFSQSNRCPSCDYGKPSSITEITSNATA